MTRRGTGWSELRTLVVNTHAGTAIDRPRRTSGNPRRRSALTRLIRAHRPDVVVLLEVRNMAVVRRAAPGYTRVPGRLVGREGVVVLLRRRTVATHALAWSAHRITPYRDRMHPERRLVRADAHHKPSGRPLTVLGVHLWAMGGPDSGWASPRDVVEKHVDQTRRFAAAATNTEDEAVVLAPGDWNEDLDQRDERGGQSAVAVMRTAGLRFAHRDADQHGSTSLNGRSLLDDVAYRARPWCELVTRRVVTIPDPAADHRAVLTVHRIRHLEAA